MGQARTYVIIFRKRVNLGLVSQASKRGREYDAVSVRLKDVSALGRKSIRPTEPLLRE
jgi:hypothetical protein